MGEHIDCHNDHLQSLLRQEKSPTYQTDDYLGIVARPRRLLEGGSHPNDAELPYSAATSVTPPHHHGWKMTTRGRWQMGQWFYHVVDDFSFPREFAMVAMDYVDRYLSRVPTVPSTKDEIQLVGLTSFYLAVKLFQAGPVLSTKQMEIISGGAFSSQQVSSMEQKLLFVLEWSLHPPCSANYLRLFFLVLSSHRRVPTSIQQEAVVPLALKMLHAAVLDYFFVAHSLPASHLAAAALINALEVLDNTSTPLISSHPSVEDLLHVLELHTGTQMDEGQVSLCRQRLWTIQEPPAAHPHASRCVTSSPTNSISQLQQQRGNCSDPRSVSAFSSHLGTKRGDTSPQPSPTSILSASDANDGLSSTSNHRQLFSSTTVVI